VRRRTRSRQRSAGVTLIVAGHAAPVVGMHSIAKRSQSHPASVTACSGSEPNARTVPPTQNHTTPAGFPSCFITVMAPYCHFPANQTVAPKGKIVRYINAASDGNSSVSVIHKTAPFQLLEELLRVGFDFVADYLVLTHLNSTSMCETPSDMSSLRG
jgi:hypothetical protein